MSTYAFKVIYIEIEYLKKRSLIHKVFDNVFILNIHKQNTTCNLSRSVHSDLDLYRIAELINYNCEYLLYFR